MARTLFVDCGSGVTGRGVLGALVDLGVAPSPVIHAVAGLEPARELRFEPESAGTRARVLGGAPTRSTVDAADLPGEAARFAEGALARLAAADARADALVVAGVAFAVHQLNPERVVASRVNVGDDAPSEAVVEILGDVADHLDFDGDAVVTPVGAALLRALVRDEDLGVPEPAWHAAPARGRGFGEAAPGRALDVALGDAP